MSNAGPSTQQALQPEAKYSKLLIASLALNLLIIGLVGGAVISHRWRGPHDMNPGDPGLRGFMRSLPKDRRELIRTSGEQARQAWRPLRAAVQKARAEVNAALSAVPIDLARVEKSMNELIDAEAAARRAGIGVLVRAVSQMTPEERERFQIWRRKHEPRFGRPRRDEAPDLDAGPPPSPSAPAPPSK